jgi:hypothetical protein
MPPAVTNKKMAAGHSPPPSSADQISQVSVRSRIEIEGRPSEIQGVSEAELLVGGSYGPK